MIEAMGMAARIFFAAGAKKVMTSHRKKTVLYGTEDIFLLAEMGVGGTDISLISAHPQGGNRMAEKVPSVVDSNCRVHGIKNLFVCDASVFPTSVGVNPQISVMALAVHAANHINQSSEFS
jgi:choline dehydrogenase-like flavoprotein